MTSQRLGDLAGIDLAVADLNGDIAISSALRSCVMTFESAWTTVTRMSLLFSSQTWVMPSFVPSRPFTLRVAVSSSPAPPTACFDVHVGRQVETHKRVNPAFGVGSMMSIRRL